MDNSFRVMNNNISQARQTLVWMVEWVKLALDGDNMGLVEIMLFIHQVRPFTGPNLHSLAILIN